MTRYLAALLQVTALVMKAIEFTATRLLNDLRHTHVTQEFYVQNNWIVLVIILMNQIQVRTFEDEGVGTTRGCREDDTRSCPSVRMPLVAARQEKNFDTMQ